jgi:hypothetical protein
MRAGQLPLDEQMTRLRDALDLNRTLGAVLGRAASMNLPGWYLVAGCLYQTVWNVLTGQPPEAGILDYDLVYFDASDLSWEAEDAVIRAGDEVFAGLAALVQIRNQARVHLWYEQKFGRPCPPHPSSEAAIDTYEATVASLGVRLESGGRWRVYAPYGLSDVFNLVARPNPVLATRDVYDTKTARWQGQWPSLTVLPWRVLPAIPGRQLSCQRMMTVLPVVAAGFGRLESGPARLGFTPRRRGCPRGRPSARRGGAPGLSTVSSSARRSRRRGRSSRSRGRC